MSDYDLKFKTPFSFIMSGAIGPSKTSYYSRLLQNNYLVLQREDCCSETLVVALKHHIPRGRTGEFRWWW